MTINYIIVITVVLRFVVFAFCCSATDVYGFDQRKAAEMSLTIVRLRLEYIILLLTVSSFVHMKMKIIKYIKI